MLWERLSLGYTTIIDGTLSFLDTLLSGTCERIAQKRNMYIYCLLARRKSQPTKQVPDFTSIEVLALQHDMLHGLPILSAYADLKEHVMGLVYPSSFFVFEISQNN